jgi:ubiquinone biosynthesis protein
MMGSFTLAFRSSVAHLIAGLAEKNHQQVMRSILDMSEEGYTADTTKMLSDVEEFSGTHLNQPLRDIRLEIVLNKLLEMLRKNGLRMKGSFYLGIKALTQVEAIGRSLNPDLNFIVLGEPYAMKLIEGKYQPRRLFELGRKLLGESIDFLDDFPHDFRNLYQRIKHGKISIPLEHKIDPEGFEPLRKTLDSIANRLTNAILTASVLICSSILVLSGLPPKIGSVPIIGLAGLIWGAYMCLRLVLSIWKHGGL